MKKKKSKLPLIIAVVIFALITSLTGVGWLFLAREHNEARNIPIDTTNFNVLKDGIYTGEYDGGMYKWRVKKVKVTVSSGKVNKILSLDSPGSENELFNRVIKAQSLGVDAVSGATLTSKANLKAIESAIIKAK